MTRTSLLLVAVTVIAACGQVNGPEGSEGLSAFAIDTLVTARVTENIMECVVDGQCALRLEFADTTVVALYAPGEWLFEHCSIPNEVASAGFEVQASETVDVIVSDCGDAGDALMRLDRRSGS